VSFSVALGLGFALATAFTSILGFLYKHRGAVAAPDVRWDAPLRSTIALFRSRWYAIGLAVAMGSWGLHVAALALAPISLVQSIIAGGLVLLTVIADRVFDLEVSRREWIGVALTAIGLAFLAATLEGAADSAHDDWAAGRLAVYAGVATALGTAMVVVSRRVRAEGLALAVAAGALWGASDICIKALSGRLDDLGAGVVLHPLAFAILALSLYGLLVSGRSLQAGDAVPVIAVTSATANVLTIASGPIVFGEPMPGDAFGVTLRVLAFVLVIGAAALTPPPVRAVEPA
jgi:drug/metabolite transporter (DMT)-like permease